MTEITKIIEMIKQLSVTGSAAEDKDFQSLFSAVSELRTRITERSSDAQLPDDAVLEEATPNRSS